MSSRTAVLNTLMGPWSRRTGLGCIAAEVPDGDMEAKSLPLAADQIVGQGFNQFIVTRLDALARGEEFQMKLVLPSKLEQYAVSIHKSGIEGNVLHIRVEMATWFLTLFAPQMNAEYDL